MARLLILCEYPTLSGGERSMLSTLDGVARAGFDVHVMAPGEGPMAAVCRARAIPVISFPRADGEKSNLSLAQRREQLAGQLRHLRPDVLHANSLAMGRLSGPVAAESGVPSLAHLRDIIKLNRQAVCDLDGHRRLLAVSEAVRRFHVAGGVAADKVSVLYNGVDLAQFCPRSPTGYLHRELGIPPDTPLIGSIGQICLRKAQDILLAAATRLTAHGPRSTAHWLLIGQRWSDKPESRRFEAELQAAAEGLAGRVHFLGSREDVSRLLNELTLLVHTARQEPLGRVLLESAASGVPVVATDVGGTREIFPLESNSARLVPPDNPDALARAIGELLAQPDERAALATAARRRAEEQFDVAQATAALVEHYRTVAEGG